MSLVNAFTALTLLFSAGSSTAPHEIDNSVIDKFEKLELGSTNVRCNRSDTISRYSRFYYIEDGMVNSFWIRIAENREDKLKSLNQQSRKSYQDYINKFRPGFKLVNKEEFEKLPKMTDSDCLMFYDKFSFEQGNMK
jgi:hypothetical protein